MSVHDIFSKRGKPLPDVFTYDALPDTFRQQAGFIIKDTHGCFEQDSKPSDLILLQIHSTLVREHGIPYLDCSSRDATEQIYHCIRNHANHLLVLDIVELCIKAIPFLKDTAEDDSSYRYDGLSYSEAVSQLNCRFRENGLGYTFDESANVLLRVDNLATHATIVQPALVLLANPDYAVANAEFMSALECYKLGNLAEAITKAGAAYESVMKVVLDKHKTWPQHPDGNASKLVNAIVNGSGLDGGFQQVLLATANVRNLKGSAHGGGKTPRIAEEHHCQLTLNLAAASIVYIAEEFG